MSTNVGSVVKFFPSAQNGFTTTLASTISSGAATVPLNSIAGYNNGEVAVMIIEPTSATAKQTFTGTVDTSGVRLTGVIWTAGTNQTHLSGVTVVDYESATHFSIISKGILQQHNQDGTHGTITSTSLTNVGPFTQTGVTALNGSWDGWIGANESWAFASGTTITVPTDATTKYDKGDFIKITQSATVKYFVIASLTSTVLTVAPVNGTDTVANSAISANAYSKARTPHGIPLVGTLPYNPYKFRVYLSGNTTTNVPVPFDTKDYDTSSNVDVVTHKGRFTAPVAGFYLLTAHLNFAGLTGGTGYNVSLQINGSVGYTGSQHITGAPTGSVAANMTEILHLSAGDFAEVLQNFTGGLTITGGASSSNFSGFLVSAT